MLFLCVCVCFFLVTLGELKWVQRHLVMMSHLDSACTLSFSTFVKSGQVTFFDTIILFTILPAHNFLFSSSKPLSWRKTSWNLWCIYFDIYVLWLHDYIYMLLNNILMCTGKPRRRKGHTRSIKSGFVGNIIPFLKKLCPPACLHSRCISSFNISVISAGAKV